MYAVCKFCVRWKPSFRPRKSTIGASYEIMQFVSCDFTSWRQNTIMVLRDRWSGFTEAHIGADRSDVSVRRHLLTWICRFGPPMVFQFDGAREFQSEEIKLLLESWKIRHQCSPRYEPASNGSVERVIQELQICLNI